MGKKKKPKLDATRDASGGGELTHNPFAALLPGGAPAPEPEPERAAAPDDGPLFEGKVVVSREKKGRGGKTVTRIRGVAAAHRDGVARRLKRALGCGAAVEGDDVILQGSLVDRAVDWLRGEGAARVSVSA